MAPGEGLPKGAVFPGENVMDDVHATAQSVWDVRRVIAWIRAQQPGAPIGLNSISLGGYVASLVASLDDDLTCAILECRRRTWSNYSASTRTAKDDPAG